MRSAGSSASKHGLHGRLHYYEPGGDFAGFHDSVTNEIIDASCTSNHIDLFIEGLELFEEGKHFQIESIQGVSSVLKEREDEMSDEGDSDESDFYLSVNTFVHEKDE